MFDNNNIIKKPLEFINSIVEKDKDIFEEEFEKFNDFYNLTSGGGFGYDAPGTLGGAGGSGIVIIAYPA